ncbi:phosphonate C-P lyase system protein PhnH [Granulicoccus phenolivorans]|uniref:phosphonate C-P lyase system protein PhnH n=1 Tax=Granulicoccus phenolivorans TaxID=266854 RepID=UPI0003F954FF|nr:phosphonate C-P lyase system protein PhnH [Granulicoccus phenolivorans]
MNTLTEAHPRPVEPGAAIPGLLDAEQRQRMFRALMTALAEPGRITRLSAGPVPNPTVEAESPAIEAESPAVEAESPAVAAESFAPVAAPLLVLADLLTPVAATDEGAAADLRRIAARTRAPLTRLDRARFVLAYAPIAGTDLAALDAGTALRPHTASMLCQQVEQLSTDPATPTAATWTLRGPGIDGTTTVGVTGPDVGFVAARAAVTADFPRGVDMFLISTAGDVLGLPRTTRIEVTR